MSEPVIREAGPADYGAALALYRELAGEIPVIDGEPGRARYAELLGHPGTVLIGAELEGALVSIATLHILPNMTFAGRPYALVENVVTAERWQGRGLARAVMGRLIETAWAADCYKIMLLTGRGIGARGFYAKLGFSDDAKHGMMLRRAPPRRPIPSGEAR